MFWARIHRCRLMKPTRQVDSGSCRTRGRRMPAPALFLILAVLPVSVAGAQRGWARRPHHRQIDLDAPVANGFVLLVGTYVAPPYRVEVRGEEIVLNGHPIRPGAILFSNSPGRDADPSFPRGPATPHTMAGLLARRLQGNGLVLTFDDGSLLMLRWPTSLHVLDILLSAAGEQEKSEELAAVLPGSPEQWGRVLSSFDAPPDLAQRVESLSLTSDRGEPMMSRQTTRRGDDGEWVRVAAYATMPLCVAAAVVGIGMLIKSRSTTTAPPEGWRHVDSTGRRARLVWRLVLLLWVLNGLDLVCTLLARDMGGGFVEMNPVGRLLLDSSLALTFFKVGFLLLGSVLLMRLRRYRGAEVAAWWTCLVYAVLAFRWATYTSLLLG